MPRFAANIGWMAQEVPMMERFQLVRDLGFTAVECPLLYEHPKEDLAEGYQAAGLDFLMFNSPPGKNPGEYGIAGFKGREAEFQDTIGLALEYSKALKTEYLHILAGYREGDWREEGFEAFIENVKWACPVLAEAGITALIEPINAVADDKAAEVVEAIQNSANTGKIGDGKVFVYDLESAVRIRTGEQNNDAL